ncbi:RNA-directed DNA polymerase, eukaryota, Reverse transcriptase zinc-binding domain protein [Artemisia annua]|uniref:RNA-directed DNA polymerase, eukaryota, Reverse transcriptase zinc-binding domain protein n=1 Tax=Artemisia annua TaxID=35608 RepID=A0A2U1QIY2_ARTAN|nr:RNA-directed DNA polymerase, eukaryota, Reverse transcriptase zinc-binding domain protein [Artemisia annua]
MFMNDGFLSGMNGIGNLYTAKDPRCTPDLFALACGPLSTATSINSCVVNGVKFVRGNNMGFRRNPIPEEIQKRITKLFVTNLQDRCSGADLAGVLRQHGDKDEMTRNLSNIKMGMFKLEINIARFVLEDGEIREERVHKPTQTKVPPTRNMGGSTARFVKKGVFSFKQALTGERRGEEVQDRSVILDDRIQAHEDLLCRSLVLKLGSFEVLRNIQNILKDMGLGGGMLRYLGGLQLLISFNSNENAIMARDEFSGRPNEFLSAEVWDGQDIAFERIASVKIHGVPIHLRTNDTLDKVANLFGGEASIVWKDKLYSVWINENSGVWVPDFLSLKQTRPKADENVAHGYSSSEESDHGNNDRPNKETRIDLDDPFGLEPLILGSGVNLQRGTTGPIDFNVLNSGCPQQPSFYACEETPQQPVKDVRPAAAAEPNDRVTEEVYETTRLGAVIGAHLDNFQSLVKESVEQDGRQSGVGVAGKSAWVKGMVENYGIDFLAFQETSVSRVGGFDFSRMWGSSDFQSDVVEASGRSGGLANLWNPKKFKKTSDERDTNFIVTSGILVKDGTLLNVVNIYAPKKTTKKRALWDRLRGVIDSKPVMWILLGDFNAEYQMRDYKFTFLAGKDNGFKMSKIDRVLVCQDFFNRWPLACLRALPRGLSDHCPLLLSLEDSNYGAKPFRWFNSWLDREGCVDIVSNSLISCAFEGPADIVIIKKLNFLRGVLKEWWSSILKTEGEALANLKEDIEKFERIMEERDLAEEETWESELGEFEGVLLPNGGPILSHLFYADDALIVGKWSNANMKKTSRLLRIFYLCSGLKINIHKSYLYGMGISGEDLNNLAGSLGCKIETIQYRLSSWKAKTLSIGGRLTLVKSVLSSLPIYYLSLYKAPKAVIEKIESLMRNFLWAGTSEEKKLHWVSWEVVTLHKREGGLGVAKLDDVNATLLLKWAWRFKIQLGSLWRNVVEVIYGGRNKWNFLPVARNLTGCWKSLVTSIEQMQINGKQASWFFKGIMGNGEALRFWKDRWFGDKILMDRWPALFAMETNKNCRIIDRFRVLGSSACLASGWGNKDDWCWDEEGNRIFTVANVKRWLREDRNDSRNHLFKWESWVPLRINIHMWRTEMNRLPTRLALQRRQISLPSTLCPLCDVDDENCAHIFLHCGFAFGVWSLFENGAKLTVRLCSIWMTCS